MYDTLKNIRINNQFEPRIEFTIESMSNNDGVSVRRTHAYSKCLSMIPFDPQSLKGCSNMEEAIAKLLEEIGQESLF